MSLKGDNRFQALINYCTDSDCPDKDEVLADAYLLVRQTTGTFTDACLNILLMQGYELAQSGFADSARAIYEEVDGYVDEKSKKELYMQLRRNQGLYNSFHGDLQTAVDQFHQVMDIAIELRDSVTISQTYSDIAIPQYMIGNFSSAIKNWKKSAQYSDLWGDYDRSYSSYLNCALAFSQSDELDSASRYFDIAVELFKTHDLDVNLTDLEMNIGVLHYKKGDYAGAIEYFESVADRAFSESDDVNYAKAISNITSAYTEVGMPQKGIEYGLEALEICKRAGDSKFTVDMYAILAESYAGLGNYELAWAYKDTMLYIKDSISSLEKANNLAELEEKYQSAQKDIQIAEHQVAIANEKLQTAQERQAKEQLNTVIIFIVVALGIVLILILVVLRGYQQKRRSAAVLQEQKNIIEQKNKDITDSITYAKNLQDSILPKPSEIAKHLPNYMIFFQPRDIVSGDFYWFNENETHTYLAAADCTGHGVPGAFVSMMCYNQLNRAINELGLIDPGKILTSVSQDIRREFQNQHSKYQSTDGMDVALVSINKKTQQIKYAGAMNPLVRIRGEELTEFKGDRRAIGGRTEPGYEFATVSVDTEAKDVFYMYSDGYQDQFGGPRGKKFMSKNFKNLLMQIHRLKAEDQIDLLKRQLKDWRGDIEQIDDILIVGFEIE